MVCADKNSAFVFSLPHNRHDIDLASSPGGTAEKEVLQSTDIR